MPNEVIEKRKLWDELLARAYKLKDAHAKVGILANEANQHHEDGEMSLVEIAAVHEFGNDINPERSFLRSTFEVRQRENLIKIQTELAYQIVTKGMDPYKALGILGQWGAAEVKNSITQFDIPPALQQATIDAKGSSKPLIDTGLMKNSITYQVVDDNGQEK